MTPLRRRLFLLLAGAILITIALVPWAKEEPRAALTPGHEAAIFASGCFWCVEQAFESLPGIVSVTSGFAGGTVANPTYEQVSAGGTGHLEAVEVVFDPKRISYQQLLERYWVNADPENPDGQFCDFGPQYRSAIFPANERQQRAAETSKQQLMKSRHWIRFATEIREPGAKFYPADERHQDYYRKNPVSYRYYKATCAREQRLKYLWGKQKRRRTGSPPPSSNF